MQIFTLTTSKNRPHNKLFISDDSMSFHIIPKDEQEWKIKCSNMSFQSFCTSEGLFSHKIGYLCSIELFQIRFNYTVSLTFTDPMLMYFFHHSLCVAEWNFQHSVLKSDDCMQFKRVLNKILCVSFPHHQNGMTTFNLHTHTNTCLIFFIILFFGNEKRRKWSC